MKRKAQMENRNIIEFLPWDSDFFGMKVGRIILPKINFTKEQFINEQEKEKFDLIYGISNAAQSPSGFWESLGFHLADCSIVLSMKFNPENYKNFTYECCANLSKQEIAECYEVAEMTASVSRFYREPAIGPKLTKKMYRKWIDTALDGSFSDCLFVERAKGKIAGIHAVKTESNTGVFTLTGVRNDLLGQNIGTKLWNQSFAYWSSCEQKVTSVKSKFSITNQTSFSFHTARGFNRIEEVNYTYHYFR